MRRNTHVSVNTRRGPGLMGTMARTAVVAGTATAVSKKTSAAMDGAAAAKQAQQQAQVQAMVDQQLAEREAQMQQEQLKQQLAREQAQPMAAPAAPPMDFNNRITKLKELGALRDAGILSDAEFEAEKARILAS